MRADLILNRPALAENIREVLNQQGIDAALDIPDFVLAEYLVNCLKAYEYANFKTKQLCQ